MTITSNASGNFLYAADNNNNKIDMFDGSFNLVGSFGNNGATNQLFVTVGQGIGANELAGTFASIVYNPIPGW